MYSSALKRLERLIAAGSAHSLRGGLVGLEKESLRVTPEGTISRRAHPAGLGSALTNRYVTTDYSEALVELITPPLADRTAALDFLLHAHRFVYENLDDELLWATSMPCVLEGGAKIPVARYGNSHPGLMKTVYRRGLGLRYGRTMQVIAGVHFNYSVPEDFWPLLRDAESSEQSLPQFIADAYMGMIRNIQRLGWLIPYLYGASPAVCKSFLGGKATDMSDFDAGTYHYPFGTSLRMGDIGYQNSLEEGRGFKANYDSLDSYIRSITWGTDTPCPDYEKIGLEQHGRPVQLSVNVLQIENEHYGTIRPKQPAEWLEKPILALRRRGIRYVELRSLDVNAFHPLGISLEQLYFLELLLVFCLLADSPRINASERKAIDANQITAAHRGRELGICLARGAGRVSLHAWADEILQHMRPLAELFDGQDPARPYSRALAESLERVEDQQRTPSARMLETMHSHRESFFDFAQRVSHEHRAYLSAAPPSAEMDALLHREAARSLVRQREIEAEDYGTFSQFLANYLTQR